MHSCNCMVCNVMLIIMWSISSQLSDKKKEKSKTFIFLHWTIQRSITLTQCVISDTVACHCSTIKRSVTCHTTASTAFRSLLVVELNRRGYQWHVYIQVIGHKMPSCSIQYTSFLRQPYLVWYDQNKITKITQIFNELCCWLFSQWHFLFNPNPPYFTFWNSQIAYLWLWCILIKYD